MTRTVDLAHRDRILERVTAYVLAHGISDLALRPLAASVGLSPRTLLYHFGSKESLVAAVLGRLRERQLVTFDRLRRDGTRSPRDLCRFAMEQLTSEPMLPMMRLFFEMYALALRHPSRAPGFLKSAVEDWLRFFADPICSGTTDPVRARTTATILLAGFRGFMLDYAATGDAERIRSAMQVWLDASQSLWDGKDAA